MMRDTAGDERELGELFERHQRSLWRLGLRMTGDHDTAADLVQETFVRAMTHRVPADPRSAEAWLVRTLVNLCRDLYRSQRVRRLHAESAGAADAARQASGNPESRALAVGTLEKAMRRLPARRRAILVLHDLEGLTDRSIGLLLGLRPGTVRWHLAAARKDMKRWITGDEK